MSSDLVFLLSEIPDVLSELIFRIYRRYSSVYLNTVSLLARTRLLISAFSEGRHATGAAAAKSRIFLLSSHCKTRRIIALTKCENYNVPCVQRKKWRNVTSRKIVSDRLTFQSATMHLRSTGCGTDYIHSAACQGPPRTVADG